MKTFKLRVICIQLVMSLLLMSCGSENNTEMEKTIYTFLVGAYTENDSQGIGLLFFDPEHDEMTLKTIGPGVENPSFVIADKAERRVYAVEEISGEKGGKVKMFEFDKEKGKLNMIDEAFTQGDHPCYLALSPDEKLLVVGNYSGGNFSAYSVKDKKLELLQTIHHEESSVNRERQNQAHVHSTVFHPEQNLLLVGDLGTDKIHLYSFDTDSEKPIEFHSTPFIQVEPGSGPRHLEVLEEKNIVYLIHEMTAEVGVYHLNNDEAKHLQSVSLTDEKFEGELGAAELRVSPDQRFLYASNRGDANEITCFSISNDGKLEFKQRVSSGGKMPRNFIITHDGKYLLAAHQESSDIVVFERNLENGKLKESTLKIKIPKPVYLFELEDSK